MKKAIATPPGEPTVYVDLTEEEITLRQAEESAPPPPPPLIEQLRDLFEELSPELQADLAPLKAAVRLEMEQNRPEIARLIIERAAVPAELETIRQAMLEKFETL